MHNLMLNLNRQERYEEVEHMYQRAWEFIRTQEDQYPNTLISMADYVLTLEKKDDHDGAGIIRKFIRDYERSCEV